MVIKAPFHAHVPVFALWVVLSAACGWAQSPNLKLPPRFDEASGTTSQWVLVTAPAFATALAPLVEQRQADGFNVSVLAITNVLTHEQIQAGAMPHRFGSG